MERPGNQLGWAVALDGDTVMLGAMQTLIDGEEGRGAVHVYERANGVWSVSQSLVAADGQGGDAFGSAVAIHGGVAAISSVQRAVGGNWGAGAVYVFEHSEGSWVRTQLLTPPDPVFNHKFGVALALDAQTLAIASHTGNRVYLYERGVYGQWAPTTVLEPPAGVSGQFGLSVSVDGDRIAVGAPSTDEGAPLAHGSAWVFERVDGVWQAGQKLLPDDLDPNYSGHVFFGQNVAIQGDTVLVGARLARTQGHPSTPGAAYVFNRDAALGTWTQTQKIGAPHAGGQFGNWVALDGDRAVISAPYATVGVNGWQGRAYVYEREAGAWALAEELLASDGMHEAQFGFAVDLHGDTVAVGAVRDRSYIGAGYMYQLAGSFIVRPSVADGGGSISPAAPQTVMGGTTTAFTLSPAAGHVIGSVGGSCQGSLDGAVFTTAPIHADCTVEADFAPQVLSVAISVASGAGSISPQGVQPVNYGDHLALTVFPAAHHVVDAVGGSCGGTLSGHDFLTAAVVADCTVEVHFGPDPGDRIFADGFEPAP